MLQSNPIGVSKNVLRKTQDVQKTQTAANAVASILGLKDCGKI